MAYILSPAGPSRSAQDPGRDPGRDRSVRQVARHDRVRADHDVAADAHAVEHLGPGAEPDVVAERDAARRARLVDDRRRLALELVAAADEVRPAPRRARGAPTVTLEPEKISQWKPRFDVVAERDVAVLAGEDRAATQEDAAADVDAPVGRALGVEHHEVVDRDAVAEAHLVRVAKHDALPEDDAPAHRAEEPRVAELAQQRGRARPGPRSSSASRAS